MRIKRRERRDTRLCLFSIRNALIVASSMLEEHLQGVENLSVGTQEHVEWSKSTYTCSSESDISGLADDTIRLERLKSSESLRKSRMELQFAAYMVKMLIPDEHYGQINFIYRSFRSYR